MQKYNFFVLGALKNVKIYSVIRNAFCVLIPDFFRKQRNFSETNGRIMPKNVLKMKVFNQKILII